jgi:hypothetical protein
MALAARRFSGEHMSTMMSHKTCRQCNFEFGVYELNCRTSEWEFDCRRCGYRESQEWIAAENGSRIGWRHETLGGHGALWATRPGVGVSTFYGLHSAHEVEEAAQKMRNSIAKGELDAESSYVTRWNAETKCAEVVAGKWHESPKEDQ